MAFRACVIVNPASANGATGRHWPELMRALDRVLISGSYVVPLFYLPEQWVARWNYVQHPARTSLYGYLPETWWQIPAKQESPDKRGLPGKQGSALQ